MAYTTDLTKVYDRFGAIGVREDLQDRIDLMTPYDAPLMAELPQKSTTQTMFENLTDDLARPSTAATAIEGADFADVASVLRARLQNVCYIVRKFWDVTGTQRAVLSAGIDDEYAYQGWKRIQETIMQAEFNNIWGEYAAGAANTSGRQTLGIMGWIVATGEGHHRANSNAYDSADAWATDLASIAGASLDVNRFYSHYVAGGNTGSTDPDDLTTANTITRSDFMSKVLQPAYNRGFTVDGSRMFCGATIKRFVSQMANVYVGSSSDYPINTRNIGANGRAVSDTIDWFETDFGTVGTNIHRMFEGASGIAFDVTEYGDTAGSGADESPVPAQSFMLLEMDRWCLRSLRGLEVHPLAKIGDSTKGMCQLEMGVECGNPAAGIAVSGVTAYA